MKKTVAFLISHKENENRRALLPHDLAMVRNREQIYIEKGYGSIVGYSDEDYLQWGIAGVCSREEALQKEVICDPKVGDAEYLSELRGKVVFGWLHAVQNRDITDRLVEGTLTAYAWEDMYLNHRHVFWRNNEIAGEAAISHAYLCHGVFPYRTKVALLGRGNTARGALKTLHYMGADVMTYDKRCEKLFREELGEYDVVVNAILWDTQRRDHILYHDDLKRMKRGAMIIDISCDRNGAIETSVPTTIAEPTYMVEGVRHYVVDHTPSLFYKTTSESISCEVVKYIDALIEGESNEVLEGALAVRNGEITDARILEFQGRKK